MSLSAVWKVLTGQDVRHAKEALGAAYPTAPGVLGFLRANRRAGQEYLTQRVREYARTAQVPIDLLAWAEPATRDVSELTVTSGGTGRTHVIHNLDLEGEQRRSYLDRLAAFIAQDLA